VASKSNSRISIDIITSEGMGDIITSEGVIEGERVGTSGASVAMVGATVGTTAERAIEGASVGPTDGPTVGAPVGTSDGAGVAAIGQNSPFALPRSRCVKIQ
jgi:hypothetical protein